MDPAHVDAAAEIIVAARLDHAPIGTLPDELTPRDEAGAYAVQNEVHRRLTAAGFGEVVGWKIGCTTRIMQELLSLDHPVCGGIFAPTIREREAVLQRADHVRPGVESEIVVRLGRDLPASGGPYDRRSAASAIACCYGGFELVDSRVLDRDPSTTPLRIADDYGGAGSVLGDPREDFDPLALDSVRTTLYVNGEEFGRGTGDLVLGHPLEALAWIANALPLRGRMLHEGDIVSLGSVVLPRHLEAGEDAHVVHEPLGEAFVRVV
jgi:2-oxo-3-hexenedioate decarboxylase/2-keto-4-pentenoate hydratase